MRFGETLKDSVRKLYPGSFALVMATGIISIGAHQLHYEWVSQWLVVLNTIQYVILFILLMGRLLFYFSDFLHDLSDHGNGAGFLTVAAGSGILANQYLQLEQSAWAGLFLWSLCVVSWLAFLYSFFILLSLKEDKPTLQRGMNGSWLLMVVSTQSVCIAGTLLIPWLALTAATAVLFFLMLFFLGFVLYIVLITLNIYRLSFFALHAEDFKPSYWIDMGAAAISCLAGITLLDAMKEGTAVTELVPVVKAACLLFWIAASWWLPIIVILELWRFIKKPVRYQPAFWSMVFPLGMYSVASGRLSGTVSFAVLHPLSVFFWWVAIVAWAVLFFSMLWAVFVDLSGKEAQVHKTDLS